MDADRWSQALYPTPPDLIHALREHKWSDQEVFWIIKHGVKDTGMSAFGDSHSDEEIWALTALVRQSLDLSPEEYRVMTERTASETNPPASQPPQSGSSHQH